jgi:preprotein translocase subunit SecG
MCIYLLGKSLTELNVFGLHLGGSNDYAVLVLAALLIIYWLVMYLAYSKRDDEIQKEQQHLLLKHVKRIKERIVVLNKNIEENKSNDVIRNHYQQELNNEKNNFNIYEKQISRTAKAGSLNFALKKVEYWLPITTGIAALIFICKDIVQ